LFVEEAAGTSLSCADLTAASGHPALDTTISR
jgi:hypothetical protein